MKNAICAATLLLGLAAGTANAQVLVLGGGIAEDCYEAAKFETVSPRKGAEICTRAIELEAMKPSNRAATFTNRGVLQMRAGLYEKALSDYATAKRIRPDTGETFEYLMEHFGKNQAIEKIVTCSVFVRRSSSFVPNYFHKDIVGKDWVVFPWEKTPSK